MYIKLQGFLPSFSYILQLTSMWIGLVGQQNGNSCITFWTISYFPLDLSVLKRWCSNTIIFLEVYLVRKNFTGVPKWSKGRLGEGQLETPQESRKQCWGNLQSFAWEATILFYLSTTFYYNLRKIMQHWHTLVLYMLSLSLDAHVAKLFTCPKNMW